MLQRVVGKTPVTGFCSARGLVKTFAQEGHLVRLALVVADLVWI